MNEKEEIDKLLIDIENAKRDTKSCFSNIEEKEKAIKKMNQRHLDMALIMQSIGLKALKIHQFDLKTKK